MKNIINFIISLGFTGYIKIAPGTFASIFSIFLIFPFIHFEILNLKILIIIFIIMFIIALILIKLHTDINQIHDSKEIVIDEFLGIFFILLFYELLFIYNNLLTLILIIIFFRFFDIIKLFPANIIDKKMQNSLGVILDDIIAATYCIITVYLFNVSFT
tara:strand:- start:758 stop:1234 length:477 start_codon:yes stop_codon:yes gene_type:complete